MGNEKEGVSKKYTLFLYEIKSKYVHEKYKRKFTFLTSRQKRIGRTRKGANYLKTFIIVVIITLTINSPSV